MDSPTSLANLRKLLADLYPQEATIRRVVADAGLDAAHLAFHAQAINTWHVILTEAIHKGKVSALAQVICQEYTENQALQAAWQNLRELLEQGVNPVVDDRAPGQSPYKGLHFFDTQDAHLFFGREALTTSLITDVQTQNFLAVIGASGSGKSSLVRAGLIPALQGNRFSANGQLSSHRWSVYLLTPGVHPLEQLAATLTLSSESMTAQATLLDDLSRDVRSLRFYASRVANATHVDRLLVVVDQFEELFTLCRKPRERQQFVTNLLTAANHDGVTTVLITLRADFYHPCADFDDLRAALETSQRYIGAMTTKELRHAIEGPAHAGGWQLEEGLVDLLLDDVAAEPGALPLLSHALLETWRRRQGHTLTLAGYTASGRVQGAIAQTAEAVYHQQLTDEQRALVRTIFVRLTELGVGAQDTRRRVTMAELLPSQGDRTAAVQQVLKSLADTRLITIDQDRIEVAHEALIREWQTLRNWLEEDREGLRIHRDLTAAAQQWEESGCDHSYLFSEARLQRAQEWVKHSADKLNRAEDAFLHASQQVEEENRRRIEEAQQRELVQAQKLAMEAEARRAESEKSQRKLRNLVYILTIMTVLAIVTTLISVRQSALASARNLNAKAQALMQTGDYDLAALLALEASQQDPCSAGGFLDTEKSSYSEQKRSPK